MRTNRHQTLKAALCARVSSSDMDQDSETQFLLLREFVTVQGLEVDQDYSGQVSATNLARRHQRPLQLEDSRERKFNVVVVWRMDPGYRSVMSGCATLLLLDGQDPTVTGESD